MTGITTATTPGGMELGVTMAFSHHTPIDYIAGAAKLIDEAGFAAMWVPEHVVFLPEYSSRYPYSGDGKVPGNPDGVLDPFTALTYVAAHTSNVRLGTGICLVPQRQPIYTAKMVADLDYLSAGRVDFGVGIGWLEEEFDALGVDFASRAARCNEYMAAMKALWTQELASFSGETVSFESVQFNPKPVQGPHPPIYVGGESKPALRRVAAFADGWYAYSVSPEDLEAGFVVLDEMLEAQGRSRSEITIAAAPNRKIDKGEIEAYESLGVSQLIVPLFARDLDSLAGRIERIRETHNLS